MSRMRVTVHDDGLRRVFLEVAAKLEAADESFRATHAGLPFDVVIADAADALPVELNEVGLTEYARAVCAGEPFRFELR